MTIHLPENLERSIEAAVRSGHFASLDDAMTEAAALLLEKLQERKQAPAKPITQTSSAQASGPKRKPLWERAAELRQSIPAEEWEKLPTDGARQLDHYIYGSPKRTDA